MQSAPVNMRTGSRGERSKESPKQGYRPPIPQEKEERKKILEQRRSEHLTPEQLANKSSLWLQTRQTDPLRHLPMLASHHLCLVHVCRPVYMPNLSELVRKV